MISHDFTSSFALFYFLHPSSMSMNLFAPYPPLQWAHAFSRTFAAIFVLCMLYGYLFLQTDPVLRDLHGNLLRSFLFGWSGAGMNWLTLILGTVTSYVWGFLFGGTLLFCLNHCQKN